MTNPTALWQTALEAMQAFGNYYAPLLKDITDELKLPDGYGWLLQAQTFDPEPISAARLRVRSPYTAARLHNQRLAQAAAQGFLAAVSEGEYRLTPIGKQAAQRVLEATYAKMSSLRPMPLPELERLAGLLQRLVQACLAAPEPPGKWCITHSRRTDPGIGAIGADASAMVQIDQYFGDVAAYRDDAHLAAWRTHDIQGHAWEAFGFLARGATTRLGELSQQLARRGHSWDDYKQALNDLMGRGWVQEAAREFSLTAQGRIVYQSVEDMTDRYFYAPWSCFGEEDKMALQALLVSFRDHLKSP